MNKTGLFDKQQQLIEPKIIRPKWLLVLNLLSQMN
jgi:hypothetical protein